MQPTGWRCPITAPDQDFRRRMWLGGCACLLEGGGDLLVVAALADALAAPAPGGLEHDGVPDLVAAGDRLLHIVDACLQAQGVPSLPAERHRRHLPCTHQPGFATAWSNYQWKCIDQSSIECDACFWWLGSSIEGQGIRHCTQRYPQMTPTSRSSTGTPVVAADRLPRPNHRCRVAANLGMNSVQGVEGLTES